MANAGHSQIVPSAAFSRMPFTSSGSVPGLAMASLTLIPGPSAWPKFPSVRVASAGPLVVGGLDVGLGALVDVALAVGLATAAGVALDAALGVEFGVTPEVPAPQAAVRTVNNVTMTIRR